MTVIYIKEWLHRQSMRRLKLHILKGTVDDAWYPNRNEKGELEWEEVYGVPEPICVYRERTNNE
jgi:hypothetical protein